MAPHSSTLAWKTPWTEEPGGLQSMGWHRVGHAERLHFDFSLSCIGEGNGNPLQCSCLENPMVEEPGGLQRVGHDWATSTFTLRISFCSQTQLSVASPVITELEGVGSVCCSVYHTWQNQRLIRSVDQNVQQFFATSNLLHNQWSLFSLCIHIFVYKAFCPDL